MASAPKYLSGARYFLPDVQTTMMPSEGAANPVAIPFIAKLPCDSPTYHLFDDATVRQDSTTYNLKKQTL